MNERIKQFAEQAGLVWKRQPPHFTNTSNPVDFPVSVNRDLEKFAELIVQECVGRIQLHNRMDEVTEQWVYDNLVSDVKEHFGVK